MNNMQKSTHDADRIYMFQTLMKDTDGDYIAVLSDDSIDRYGEIVGKKALEGIKDDVGYIAALTDHTNSVDNLIGEWVDRRVETREGHTALVARPKFYMSNPKAQMIKGMLDEGAQVGVSIGARVVDKIEEKIDGVKRTVYTALELLEASFVAIPANKYSQAMKMARSFVAQKSDEDDTMAEDNTTVNKELLDKEIEARKALEAQVEELKKNNEELVKELEEAKAEPEQESAKEAEEPEQVQESADISELRKQYDELKQIVEKMQKAPVHKAVDTTPEDVDTAKKNVAEMGKNDLPVVRK